jgi:hypothetical protein
MKAKTDNNVWDKKRSAGVNRETRRKGWVCAMEVSFLDYVNGEM